MSATPLVHEADWKRRAVWTPDGGYYRLETGDTGEVEVRLFLTERLLSEAEPTLYRQIVHATRFPGVRLVCITPDAHYGYGVPVGCVILTDRNPGSGGSVDRAIVELQNAVRLDSTNGDAKANLELALGLAPPDSPFRSTRHGSSGRRRGGASETTPGRGY